MLSLAYYTNNYASIIDVGLVTSTTGLKVHGMLATGGGYMMRVKGFGSMATDMCVCGSAYKTQGRNHSLRGPKIHCPIAELIIDKVGQLLGVSQVQRVAK